MRLVNSSIAVLFVLFAAVQYNDPDPWLWIALYIFVALLSALAATNRFPKWIIRGGIAGCLIGMGMLLPDFIEWLSSGAESITQSMKAEKPHIELTREFLGLLLCAIALGFLHWQASKKS